MNSVIESVVGSRRLKIFTAYYLMVYTVAILSLNLIKSYVPFFGQSIGSFVYILISLFVKAPLMYGLIRGIVTKDFRMTKALGAFGDVKAYGAYAVYVAATLAYEGASYLVSLIPFEIVGTVMSVLMIVVSLLVNCFLVKMYFDSIDNGGKPDLVKSFKGCGTALGRVPLKILGAEILFIVSRYLSLYISAMFVSLLPQYAAVSLVFSCLNEILYGFLILIWPIYYLYYKTIFEY